jgi:hypothetical protein
MDNSPPREFGKRLPATATTAAPQPVKRSRHVALLLTGAFAVGGAAYTLMPAENCTPNGPAMAAPSSPAAAAPCTSRRSFSSWGHGGGGGWSRSNFFGGDSANSSSSTATGSGETTRGGFGGFARAFAGHFSGG